MAEDLLGASFPDLKELENKVGRKTPESLLIWMRDAADCWSSDQGERRDSSSAGGHSLSDKLSNLKQEMRWLRSADVRILRQLVAVHEGIEAMRWLMVERGTLASRGSSLTGSLSSLVTLEEPGPSMYLCRESPSPTYQEDVTETTGEESEDHQLHSDNGHSDRRSHFDVLSPVSTEARPPKPPHSKSAVSCSTETSSTPAKSLVSSNVPSSQYSDELPSQDIKVCADPLRSALLRSFQPSRSSVEAVVCSFEPKQQSTERNQKTQNDVAEADESESNRHEGLLGYDAQWRWVESQDDVTFL